MTSGLKSFYTIRKNITEQCSEKSFKGDILVGTVEGKPAAAEAKEKDRYIRVLSLQQCDFCSHKFVSATALKEHMQTHEQEFPVECRICYARFREELELGEHIKDKHVLNHETFASISEGSSDSFRNVPFNNESSDSSSELEDSSGVCCVKCRIYKFKSWKDFETHHKIHVQNPKVRLHKLNWSVPYRGRSRRCARKSTFSYSLIPRSSLKLTLKLNPTRNSDRGEESSSPKKVLVGPGLYPDDGLLDGVKSEELKSEDLKQEEWLDEAMQETADQPDNEEATKDKDTSEEIDDVFQEAINDLKLLGQEEDAENQQKSGTSEGDATPENMVEANKELSGDTEEGAGDGEQSKSFSEDGADNEGDDYLETKLADLFSDTGSTKVESQASADDSQEKSAEENSSAENSNMQWDASGSENGSNLTSTTPFPAKEENLGLTGEDSDTIIRDFLNNEGAKPEPTPLVGTDSEYISIDKLGRESAKVESAPSTPEVIVCDVCCERVPDQATLEEHRVRHAQVRCRCNLCDYAGPNEEDLANHMQAAHSNGQSVPPPHPPMPSPLMEMQQQVQMQMSSSPRHPPPLYRSPTSTPPGMMPGTPPGMGMQPGGPGMQQFSSPGGPMSGDQPQAPLMPPYNQATYQQGNRQGSPSFSPRMQMSPHRPYGNQGMQPNQRQLGPGPRMPMQMNQQRLGQHPPGISPQKRGAPMIGQSPQKQRRLDVSIPAKQNDADCQIIAVQQRGEGVPIIQNVQGASRGGANAGPESTIHLTDSITLSVRQQEREAGQKGNDANAVANLLATRGITVTPAGVTKGQKTVNSPQRHQQSHAPPPAPIQQPVTTLNLNSSISILPAAGGGRQQQNASHNSFAVPSSRGHHNQNVDRPPRPPTVDLTGDSSQSSYNFSNQNSSPGRRGVGGRFICQVCDKTFTTPEMLRQHMTIHQNAGKLPYRCSLCPAQYPTHQGLQQHRQQYHKEPVNATTELVIPVVDLKQHGALNRLSQLGIQNFIPLSQLRNQGGGYYGLPIVSSESTRNSAICNLQALAATNVLPLGPLKPLPR